MNYWQHNSYGVKDGAECYRTIGGVRWAWFSEDVDMFKGSGIRHRKMPDGQGCFIHPDDHERAFALIHARSHPQPVGSETATDAAKREGGE